MPTAIKVLGRKLLRNQPKIYTKYNKIITPGKKKLLTTVVKH